MEKLIVLLLISCIVCCLSIVEEYDYHNFPKDRVALHMPCEESNMFATKCMCHLKCSDQKCNNARDLCTKYEKSKGCKYMLIRQVGKNKVATLKRTPQPEELARFDISSFPKVGDTVNTEHWAQKSPKRSTVKISNLVNNLNNNDHIIVDKLFKANNSSPMCPITNSGFLSSSTLLQNEAKSKFLNDSIALAVLSYHAPMTLVNSMRSWEASGLLDMVTERLALLNDPLPSEHAMALQHGFQVLQPKDIPSVKLNKPNVITIGAAFYYTLKHLQSEYVLFLENDFKMDTSLSKQSIQKQLIAAAGMLRNGAEIVRLMSRKYQGCGTFKSCDHHGINLQSHNPGDRKRNWYSFYCRGRKGSEPFVSDCFHEPDFRCFTSWDSNWSLNAVMVKRSTMLTKKYPTAKGIQRTIAEIGLSQFQQQDGFESRMIPMWQTWKVPICISYDGLFIHEEIETST